MLEGNKNLYNFLQLSILSQEGEGYTEGCVTYTCTRFKILPNKFVLANFHHWQPSIVFFQTGQESDEPGAQRGEQ